MLVEAAWVAGKTPGPLRAFFLEGARPPRAADRRGGHRAQARRLRLAPLTKHKDYAWARPLTEEKRRTLELRAGQPSPSGGSGDGRTRTT